MDQQTTSMIKDADLIQNGNGNWHICWTYEASRYFLSIDNNFLEEATVLWFVYKEDAQKYLDLLNGQ